MRYTKRNKRIIKMTNAIDAATSSVHWGKRTKHYKGCAGKGGATTNFVIPDKNGGAVNA